MNELNSGEIKQARLNGI